MTSPVVALRMTPARADQMAALEEMTGLSSPAAVIDFALSTTLAHYKNDLETEGRVECMHARWAQLREHREAERQSRVAQDWEE